MPKLIKNWNELCGLENENFRLEIDTEMGCGYIVSKATNQRVAYLSTHTFYGMKYTGMSEEYIKKHCVVRNLG